MLFLRKNIVKFLSVLFIFIGFIIFFSTDLSVKKDKVKQDEIIEEVFSDKIYAYDNKKYDDILGYIEIPKYNIKRIIKYGTSDDILDDDYVGMMEMSSNLDSDFGNVILAGHNNVKVFGNLHKSKLGDEIIIETYQTKYVYKIKNKVIVDISNYNYFNESNNKILTLITCTSDKNKRLIVVCELVK